MCTRPIGTLPWQSRDNHAVAIVQLEVRLHYGSDASISLAGVYRIRSNLGSSLI